VDNWVGFRTIVTEERALDDVMQYIGQVPLVKHLVDRGKVRFNRCTFTVVRQQVVVIAPLFVFDVNDQWYVHVHKQGQVVQYAALRVWDIQ